MSDNKPITVGLRERLKVARLWLSEQMTEELLAECGNIDAMHKSLEDKYAEIKTFVDSFVDHLADAAEKREDVTLFGVDYKALPLGADGVSINVGDKGTVHNGNGIHEVKQLVFEGNNWWIGCKMEMAAGTVKRMPSSFRHHKPTVADVLCELLDKVDDDRAGQAEIIAEYAAKLRLAGDDNE